MSLTNIPCLRLTNHPRLLAPPPFIPTLWPSTFPAFLFFHSFIIHLRLQPPPIRPSAHLPTHPSTFHLYSPHSSITHSLTHLSISPSIHLAIYPPIHLHVSIQPSLLFSIHPSIHLSLTHTHLPCPPRLYAVFILSTSTEQLPPVYLAAIRRSKGTGDAVTGPGMTPATN